MFAVVCLSAMLISQMLQQGLEQSSGWFDCPLLARATWPANHKEMMGGDMCS